MCMGEVYLHDMHKGRGKYIFHSSQSEHVKEGKEKREKHPCQLLNTEQVIGIR